MDAPDRAMKYAEYVNTAGSIPFYESGFVKVMACKNEIWECIEEMPFNSFGFSGGVSLSEIQKRLRAMVEDLGDCRVFACDRVDGIPIAILDGMGISIWRKFAEPDKLNACANISPEERTSVDTSSVPLPVQTGNADEVNYFINLIDSMDENKTVTSRMILIPFLKNAEFMKLNIICSHIPKWLARDPGHYGVRIDSVTETSGNCSVVISKID